MQQCALFPYVVLLSLSSSPSLPLSQAMMLWHVLRSSKLQHIGALEVHTAPLARHARCNTWTPSTKCCCRSSQAAGKGSRGRGRGRGRGREGVPKWVAKVFRRAFVAFFAKSHALYWNLHNENTWVSFSFFCSSSSSRRVEYRRGTPARLPTGGGLNFLVQEQWFKSCLQNKKRFKF